MDLEAVYLSYLIGPGQVRGELCSLIDYNRIMPFYWRHVRKMDRDVYGMAGGSFLHTLEAQQEPDDFEEWTGRLKTITQKIERSQENVQECVNEAEKRIARATEEAIKAVAKSAAAVDEKFSSKLS